MFEDLSNHARPVGSLFPLPDSDQAWRSHRLAAEQVEFFQHEGYLTGVPMLSAAQVEALREELARLVDPRHPGNALFYEFHANESNDPEQVLFHALGAWRIEPGLHDLLWHPALTVAASQLLGGAVRFWHDQLFCKPPRHGGVVAWHQDYSYWTRSQPMAHLTCFIALDDTDQANGCIHYVPRSHLWPLLPITGLAGGMHAIQDVLTAEQKAAFQPVPAVLPKGFAAFHHPLTVHGSYGNASDRPRRAVVINVMLDGVKSASDRALLKGVPAIPCDQPIAGRFFPLLLDPAAVGL